MYDIALQKKLRDVAAGRPEEKAVPGPGVSAVVSEMARQKAASDAAFAERSASRDISVKRLSEGARRFDAEMDFKKNELSSASKENRKATAISLANLALSAGAGFADIKKAERTEALLNQQMLLRKDLLQIEKESLSAYKSAMEGVRSLYKGAFTPGSE